MEFQPVIGLEIHAELKTNTKMFCDCLNNLDEEIPNTNICPICLAHPGTLPTINKKAVQSVLLAGLALGSEILEYSKFDRKNYFYPDLPKGYQISQYDEPLCEGGFLQLFLSNDSIENQKKIQIKRIHLEEDTARLIHSQDKKSTLIDFNRAGMPLMELVTEPVMHTGKEARLFAQGLQLVLRTLDISEADMEKGLMRCEVNISLSENPKEKLGTKVEIKNLNSFRAIEKAIDFEIQRQKNVLEQGEKVIQETRGWDAEKEITYSQRLKEEATEYRYFPEPDLPLLHIYSKDKADGAFDLNELKEQMPEMPWLKQERIKEKYGFVIEEANVFIQDEELLNFFEQTVMAFNDKQIKDKAINLAKNYLVSDLKGLIDAESISWKEIKITPESFAQLMLLLLEEKISSRVAKDLLIEIVKNGGEPNQLIKEKGLEQVSGESELKEIVKEIIQNNPAAIADYQKGKTNAIQFLVGQAMAKTKGTANPVVLEKLFEEELMN